MLQENTPTTTQNKQVFPLCCIVSLRSAHSGFRTSRIVPAVAHLGVQGVFASANTVEIAAVCVHSGLPRTERQWRRIRASNRGSCILETDAQAVPTAKADGLHRATDGQGSCVGCGRRASCGAHGAPRQGARVRSKGEPLWAIFDASVKVRTRQWTQKRLAVTIMMIVALGNITISNAMV